MQMTHHNGGNMRRVIQKVKEVARVLLGKEVVARPKRVSSKERLGSSYGGWEIVPQNLTPNSVVYSFGVGDDASFDTALIDKYGVTVHAFDPTPKSVAWVKKQGFSPQFVMHEYGIADFDGTVSFNPPENSEHMSHTILSRPSTRSHAITVPVKRLTTIMRELGHSHINLLKMDIEGAEYGVISDLRQSDIRPDQLLVEFHHRFTGVGARKTMEAIKKIKKMGYDLFSMSDSREDLCFIKRQKPRA
jgi:FkbM family methyltransferase